MNIYRIHLYYILHLALDNIQCIIEFYQFLLLSESNCFIYIIVLIIISYLNKIKFEKI